MGAYMHAPLPPPHHNTVFVQPDSAPVPPPPCSTASVEQRLSSQMGAYLHTTNTKLGVFRDVIDKTAYDPLSAHDASIRIPTGEWRMGGWGGNEEVVGDGEMRGGDLLRAHDVSI